MMQKSDEITLHSVKRTDADTFCKMLEEAFAASEDDALDVDMNVDISKEVEGAFDDPNVHVVWIIHGENRIGGAIVDVNEQTRRSMLVWFFIKPALHSQGIGTKAWFAIERAWPETKVWKLGTPYSDKRNINFYVNKCGFHIVEYINDHHRDISSESGSNSSNEKSYPSNSFRFEKTM